MAEFNPNDPGIKGNIFGLPYKVNEADIVILPVPWDVTVSYRAGASKGPGSVVDASYQIDYSIPHVNKPWELKIAMESIPESLLKKSDALRVKAEEYIQWVETGKSDHPDFQNIREEINIACSKMVSWVNEQSKNLLEQNKIIGCLGGDHSTPLGLISALADSYESFGILQLDAHMDLRNAYEGLEYSHASIMRNVLKHDNISHLVQVGIRDYCEEEIEFTQSSNGKVITYFDQDVKEAIYSGGLWQNQVQQILKSLPHQVYISLDIDGLNPSLCPSTGTPVPGGLSFDELTFLLRELVRSGRNIIGFDLSEVSPGSDEWDANVGARVLYQLCIYAGISKELLQFESATS